MWFTQQPSIRSQKAETLSTWFCHRNQSDFCSNRCCNKHLRLSVNSAKPSGCFMLPLIHTTKFTSPPELFLVAHISTIQKVYEEAVTTQAKDLLSFGGILVSTSCPNHMLGSDAELRRLHVPRQKAHNFQDSHPSWPFAARLAIATAPWRPSFSQLHLCVLEIRSSKQDVPYSLDNEVIAPITPCAFLQPLIYISRMLND